ncbi:hypothetical protein [Enterococcus phage vB_Efs8_KEN04]
MSQVQVLSFRFDKFIIIRRVAFVIVATTLRTFSSVGQSIRLITERSQVRDLQCPLVACAS